MIKRKAPWFFLALVTTALVMALTLGVAAGSSHVITDEYIDVEPDGYWDAVVAAGGHQIWNFVLGADRNHKVGIEIESPVGASLNVSVDGTDFGTVSGDSILNLDLGAGSHVVRIDNPGDAPVEYELYMGVGTTLRVVKRLNPNDDPGLFNLQINSITRKANASDGDATNFVFVSPGDNTVGETAGTGTSLSNYTTVIECADLGGSIVALGSNAGPLLVPMKSGLSIVCIVTNTRITSVGGVTSFERVSGSSGSIALLAGGLAAVVAITAGGWYARKRWLGSRS